MYYMYDQININVQQQQQQQLLLLTITTNTTISTTPIYIHTIKFENCHWCVAVCLCCLL
jgi:hypothetical protein